MAEQASQVQFEMMAAANGVFKVEEMDRLVQTCDERAAAGALSGGIEDGYRRSKVAWLKREEGFDWLYNRVAQLANGFNQRFFGFDLRNVEQAIQVARYDETDQGRYDWHTDFGILEQTRKLSISVQLSDPQDYEGGDLEFDISTEITKAGRERGMAIAFPSFARHRVAPVTKGARYSLVAWIHGPRFR